MTGKEGKNTRRSQGVKAGHNSVAIQLANMNERAKEATEQIKRLAEMKAYKQDWRGFKNFNHAFDSKHMEDFFTEIISDLRVLEREGYPILKYKGGKEIFNIPCSFDIETSSFYDNYNEKAAIMYIWQFGFNGSVIYGDVVVMNGLPFSSSNEVMSWILIGSKVELLPVTTAFSW